MLSTCELVVDNTVDGKDNMEEKISEVADFRTSVGIIFNQEVICSGDTA